MNDQIIINYMDLLNLAETDTRYGTRIVRYIMLLRVT